MALDPQSKGDLAKICEIGMQIGLQVCQQMARDDVFYVPLVIAIAIRHDPDGKNTQVIGADVSFDDDQPKEGIVSVLETVASVLRGEQPPNVQHVTKILPGADLR